MNEIETLVRLKYTIPEFDTLTGIEVEIYNGYPEIVQDKIRIYWFDHNDTRFLSDVIIAALCEYEQSLIT